MIKLFHIPETNAIVAKSNNIFYSLPNLIEIEKPTILMPCKPFAIELQHSVFFPYTETTINNLSQYINDNTITIHKIVLIINIEKDTYQLCGHVPQYVLNGICNLLDK